MIAILYFGWVREAIGADGEALPLPAPSPIAALLDRLEARGGGHALALANRARLRFALNQAIVDAGAIAHPGDELAIFPPVTGG